MPKSDLLKIVVSYTIEQKNLKYVIRNIRLCGNPSIRNITLCDGQNLLGTGIV